MKYVILRAVCKFSDGSLRTIKPFVDLFKIGLQSGCKMQYNNKDYKLKLHDRWCALTFKNPYATQLVTAAYEDNGIVYGEKCIMMKTM